MEEDQNKRKRKLERNREYVINDLEKVNLKDWILLGKNGKAGNKLVQKNKSHVWL